MTSVDQPITEPDDGATVGLVRGLELTILMPCLDEAATLGGCISEADGFLRRTGVHGEILVADNGSTDGSQAIAAQMGARVVQVEERGYGETLRAGMREARGTFVIMADSDASYDFANLDTMLDGLRSGSDLVVGNRFAGGIEPGAMPCPISLDASSRSLSGTSTVVSAVCAATRQAACRTDHRAWNSPQK